MASDEREQAPARTTTTAATELDESALDARVADAGALDDVREPTGIRLENVTKRFKGGVEAVKDMTLAVEPGEFTVLVGPSGCGKSTVLRIMAGLEEVSAGRVYLGDKDVTTELPQHRDIAMVFQSYALYPRMTVRRNMGFGLRMRHTPKAERQRRVAEVAEVLGLEHLLSRRPGALSGGQRQRVAMGRAIVREPRVFLMDEPLSNLDAALRVATRIEIARLNDSMPDTTMIYVTHDQVEAMTLGQRVAVLRDGMLQQYDTPQVLFRQPVNLFVAAFIGSPSMNFVHAKIADQAVTFADVKIPLSAGSPVAGQDRDVILGIRPTAFAVASGGGSWVLHAVPEVVEELGDERYVIFDIDAPRVDTDATRAAIDAQSTDDALLLPEDRARFTVRLPTDTRVVVGQPFSLTVNPDRLYFFDAETGATLG